MRRASGLLLALSVLLPAAVAFGANRMVGIGDDCGPTPSVQVCFTPTPLTIDVGDSVTFYIYHSSVFHGPHNVVADDGSFRCAAGCDGEGGDGSPRGQSGFGQSNPALLWSFTRTFYVPGTVTYHDEVSGAAGMIIVQVPEVQAAVEYIFGQPSDGDVSSYFVTSSPSEIAMLDRGAYGGRWRRTGATFDVWSGPTDGATPACRFLHASGAHFYTPYPDECAALLAGGRSSGWQYEGNAFYLKLPADDGTCPSHTTIVYRLYNQGIHPPPTYPRNDSGAPLHRLTTSRAAFEQMRAAGWWFEGHARTFAFACSPI